MTRGQAARRRVRPARASWSRRKIAFASVVGLVTVALAYGASISALGQVKQYDDPLFVVRHVPANGLAPAILADQLMISGGPSGNLDRISMLARRSLAAEPVNPAAVRLLGLVADAQGDTQKATSFVRLSDRMSRRDIGTQLWLIQKAATDGDLNTALRHYDIALRTTADSQPVLFPKLTAALDDPEIRAGLVPLVRSNTPWMVAFFFKALQTTKQPQDLAKLVVAAGGLPNDRPEYQTFGSQLLGATVGSGEIALARRLFLTLTGASRRNLTIGPFDSATTDPRFYPLTWEPVATAVIGVAFDGNSRAANITVNSGERGVALRRVIFLAPGQHKLSVKQRQIGPRDGGWIGWRVSCYAGSTTRPTILVEPAQDTGTSPQPFTVPAGGGCASQLIELVAVAGMGQTGSDFMVDRVDIRSENAS